MPNGVGVTQSQLAEALGRKQGAINRYINQAIDGGYLKNDDTPSQGKRERLVVGDEPLPSNKVLPTVRELR
jgi:hypothetical protein